MRAADGSMVVGPRQIKVYEQADNTPAQAVQLLASANVGKLPVKRLDLVVVCSDGVTDNITPMQIAEILRVGRLNRNSPQDLAQKIVYNAMDAERKPDDVSCFVGLVLSS